MPLVACMQQGEKAAAFLVARGAQLLQGEHAQQEILVVRQGICTAGRALIPGACLCQHTSGMRSMRCRDLLRRQDFCLASPCGNPPETDRVVCSFQCPSSKTPARCGKLIVGTPTHLFTGEIVRSSPASSAQHSTRAQRAAQENENVGSVPKGAP